jgi:hypothetical protein
MIHELAQERRPMSWDNLSDLSALHARAYPDQGHPA